MITPVKTISLRLAGAALMAATAASIVTLPVPAAAQDAATAEARLKKVEAEVRAIRRACPRRASPGRQQRRC